jgi:C1A family cysteine protease
MARKIKGYGWTPDLPDGRDLLYAAPAAPLDELPPRVDLRSQCPPVYNQGKLGSCTANAIAAALEFDQIRQKEKDVFTPSRLFIYYNERAIEGTVSSDSGAQIRDGVKSVHQLGACNESAWPYAIAKFSEKPSRSCYTEAKRYQSIQYMRVTPALSQLKGCLAEGFPFVFGFSVYASFESAKVSRDGHAPMPVAGEQLLGGHAVLGVGYDEQREWFVCRNSWGPKWGMGGYFTLPYPYLVQATLSSDFWTIRSVEEG